MPPVIELRNVTKIFGGGFFSRQRTVAVEDFSLEVTGDEAGITALVGESGSGKTTIARLILGFEQPTRGEVLYMGRDLSKLSRGERREFRREVQVVFQDPFESFNPFYKIDHAFHLPIRKFHLSRSKSHRRDLISKALEMVGLRPEDTLGRYPHQLSGGQRQRIMVARALMLQPKLIVADEPVSMIDASLRATVLERVRALSVEFGIPILYITHDLTTAYEICQNIIVLYGGSVVEAADIEQVVTKPEHPYTQLLISSIPMPDPNRPWGQGEKVTTTRSDDEMAISSGGCKFARRCPHRMPVCHEETPPLFQTSEVRGTACHLYKDYPRISPEDLNSALRAAASSPPRIGSGLRS